MARGAVAHDHHEAVAAAPGGVGPGRTTSVVGVAVAAAVPVAILLGGATGVPAVALSVVAVAVAVGWRWVPGFWSAVGRGLLAGGAAGLLVLGPGYRAAMRVVAVLEPTMQPASTVGGTVFIVVGIGGLLGALVTAWASVLARSLALPRWGGTAVLAVASSLLLLGGREQRTEIAELGAGPLVNVLLFGGVTVGFALLADHWARPAGVAAARRARRGWGRRNAARRDVAG